MMFFVCENSAIACNLNKPEIGHTKNKKHLVKTEKRVVQKLKQY